MYFSPNPYANPNPTDSISTFIQISVETFSIRVFLNSSRSMVARKIARTKMTTKTPINAHFRKVFAIFDFLDRVFSVSEALKLKLSEVLPIFYSRIIPLV
tara:strand:+ start:247 stop:546 length:300 start_codon:yes stop_codon:yes gene_type:complete